MKKFVLILLVFVSVAAQAQDSKIVTEQYMAYSKLIIEKNFEKGFDYLNEGIFEIAPRDQMMQVMDQTFNNPELTVEMTMPEVSDFSTAKKIEAKYYIKFKSLNVVRMRMNTLINPEKTAEENKAMIDMLKQSFESKFGAGNVSYDEKTNFFSLKATKPVIAASTDKKNWKFITVDSDEMKPMLESFIPKELLVD